MYGSWLTSAVYYRTCLYPNHAQRAFELLDKDGNGVITVQELQTAAEQVRTLAHPSTYLAHAKLRAQARLHAS